MCRLVIMDIRRLKCKWRFQPSLGELCTLKGKSATGQTSEEIGGNINNHKVFA